jgi:hypothetical protein
MATPSPRKPQPRPAARSRQPKSTVPLHLREPQKLIDPRWILKAFAATLAFAIVCAYATLCFLFMQGQWQLVLHPSRTVASTPAAVHLAFTEVHFDDDTAGQPQLDGWWIPSDSSTTPTNSAAPTALMLHSGSGSMADALPRALTLHNQHLNVLLFDYRGYGRSAGRHPDQASMQSDADAALTYLTTLQHVPLSSILLYGSGVGASLAVRVAAAHPQIPALILDAPDGDFAERARLDARSHLIPTGLLFNQTFPLADPLHTLATPKLLISYTTAAEPPLALQRAADPKITIELPTPNDPALLAGLHRFLDLYLIHTPAS